MSFYSKMLLIVQFLEVKNNRSMYYLQLILYTDIPRIPCVTFHIWKYFV